MNNMNFSPDKMDTLLNIAGKKLGKDPEALKQQLESGDLSHVINGLDKNAQNKIGKLLNNPKELEAVLQSDKVKNMLSGLIGKK